MSRSRRDAMVEAIATIEAERTKPRRRRAPPPSITAQKTRPIRADDRGPWTFTSSTTPAPVDADQDADDQDAAEARAEYEQNQDDA